MVHWTDRTISFDLFETNADWCSNVRNMNESYLFCSFDLRNWSERTECRHTPWHLSKNWFFGLVCIAGVIANHHSLRIRQSIEKMHILKSTKFGEKQLKIKKNPNWFQFVCFVTWISDHIYLYDSNIAICRQLACFSNTHTRRAINTRAYIITAIVADRSHSRNKILLFSRRFHSDGCTEWRTVFRRDREPSRIVFSSSPSTKNEKKRRILDAFFTGEESVENVARDLGHGSWCKFVIYPRRCWVYK